MLCERCKIREATIQYTEVVNGVKKEHNFCTQCAREMNFGDVSAIFDSEFPFSKILSALLGEEGKNENADLAQIVCPTCHTTYQEFVENSRFGCPDCYEVFDILISDSIKQLQGSDQHKGKRPKYGLKMTAESRITEKSETDESPAKEKKPAGKSSAVSSAGKPDPERAERIGEIRALKKKLKEAIRDEQYEVAAKCRDRIKELEKDGSDKKNGGGADHAEMV